MNDKKAHWEKIYTTKELTDVSWYQNKPQTSLDLIAELKLNKDARIIDIGGGDSFLVEYLLDDGYTDITVLDISEAALARAKKRLGEKAAAVKWIVADAATFETEEQYDLWHDRAAFHFLTEESQVSHYISTLRKAIAKNGAVVLGTFSRSGPLKCSGIAIQQYSIEEMKALLEEDFEATHCENIDHHTPFDTVQNFTFCSFKRR
ncbi:class I SAM-dependent methyltransferase [Gillisia sp. M10.2A]|uniref:Class I SAM-dependent methyltransferase n=1 Tax=Gillisia lutea TaxID=2909668 RepID=A0ABS9EJ15_9FLAO|nr:class I SAM-dependent methyltransferase [Gillisia lutea]MCF4101431.1 class I SAM-dependent methyltransferase [Gillisia lutea]